jgi:hypothetical protein
VAYKLSLNRKHIGSDQDQIQQIWNQTFAKPEISTTSKGKAFTVFEFTSDGDLNNQVASK